MFCIGIKISVLSYNKTPERTIPMLNLSPIRILISLGLGAWSGLLIGGYFLGLEQIQKLHQFHQGLVLFIPIVFLINIWIRRTSNFLPTTMKEIREASESETVIWSWLMVPYNLFTSLVSHLVGGSVGRESTAVVISSTSTLWTKMNWTFWMPIVVSSSFAVATGSILVAIIACVELFFTKIEQKIYVLISAWTGILMLKSLKVSPLIPESMRNVDNKGFLSALIFCLALGLLTGYFARLYKFLVKKMKTFFGNFRNWKKIALGFLVALTLSCVFILTSSDASKSLSTNHMATIFSGEIGLDFPLQKALLTLLFISIGFIGGEFVPSVIIGMSLGVLSAKYLGENIQFGFAMGAFSVFAGLSKLKWTSLALVFSYFGFANMIWGVLVISLANAFSGEETLF